MAAQDPRRDEGGDPCPPVHAVNIDQPQAFIDAVLPFLGRPREQGNAESPPHEDICRCGVTDRRRRHGRRLAQQLPPIGGPYPPPFTATLSNNTPLGVRAWMAGEATRAPRHFRSIMSAAVRARRSISHSATSAASGLFYKKDRLYLQFRKGRPGRLEKADWGDNWMWQ